MSTVFLGAISSELSRNELLGAGINSSGMHFYNLGLIELANFLIRIKPLFSLFGSSSTMYVSLGEFSYDDI